MIRTFIMLCAASMLIGTAAPAELLPARTLHCTLGRMTNFDPHREQRASEIVYEGAHEFVLFLPAAPRRITPPPDATERPEPVDPRTRILADPDGLTARFPKHFDRVVDLWPERTELSALIDDPLVNVVVISEINPAAGYARILMAQATDAATYDLTNLYGGVCRIS